MMQTHPLDLSVCIITLNEADRLEPCLASLPQDVEIIILDSGSTDQTSALAERYGAKFFTEKFTDYASQKNKALDLATRSWILSLDADERLEPELAQEICKLVTKNHQRAYVCRRSLVFLGKKLRFGGSGDTVVRLFPKNFCRFNGEIHEKISIQDGSRPLPLKHKIVHESYRSLTDYFTKFNRYTSLMVQKYENSGRAKPSTFTIFLRADWEFFKRVFLLGAFLDGYHGMLNAYLASFYVLIKYAKRREF